MVPGDETESLGELEGAGAWCRWGGLWPCLDIDRLTDMLKRVIEALKAG